MESGARDGAVVISGSGLMVRVFFFAQGLGRCLREDLDAFFQVSSSQSFAIFAVFLLLPQWLTLRRLPWVVRFCPGWGRDTRFHIAGAHLAVLQTRDLKLSGLQHTGCHGLRLELCKVSTSMFWLAGLGVLMPFERGGGSKAKVKTKLGRFCWQRRRLVSFEECFLRL